MYPSLRVCLSINLQLIQLRFHPYLHVCLSYLLLVHFRRVPCAASIRMYSFIYLSIQLSFFALHTKSWIYSIYLSLRLSIIIYFAHISIHVSLLVYLSIHHLFIYSSIFLLAFRSSLHFSIMLSDCSQTFVSCQLHYETGHQARRQSAIRFTWSIHLSICILRTEDISYYIHSVNHHQSIQRQPPEHFSFVKW